jgi:hypothetical protein
MGSIAKGGLIWAYLWLEVGVKFKVGVPSANHNT